MARILVVDDDPRVQRCVGAALRAAGYAVESATTIGDALRALLDRPAFDAVLLDLGMPDGDGSDALGEIARTVPLCSIVVHTGHVDRESLLRRLYPLVDFLAKPASRDDLWAAISRACGKRRKRVATDPGLQRLTAEILTALGGRHGR